MITIIDYGMGNLRSVQKAFERIGRKAVISCDRQKISGASLAVLPGVGAFDAAMGNLGRLGLIEPIKKYITSGRPFLGLCLGLQVLFESSEEGGAEGLGLLKGRVKKFGAGAGLKIPHMGWNRVKRGGGPCSRQSGKIFKGIKDESYFYFVHSFYVEPDYESIISGATLYGKEFASCVLCGNIFATQFHPEKSQENGLKLLRNYADYTGN